LPLRSVVGINAALAPPDMPGLFARPVQALARSPLLGALTAALADSDFVFDSLLRSTGSSLSPAQQALYRMFARSPVHATAVMNMFANWNLEPLVAGLPKVTVPVTLVVGAKDEWVPPADTVRMAARLPQARIITLDGAGHLAHEDMPERVATIIASSLPPTRDGRA
jgi:magnesium chelatase accessory protein